MNSQAPSPVPQTAPAQDPLAGLQDIHLPPDIGYWPPAFGWWILLLLVITIIAILIFFIRRKKSRNAYRAPALAELARAAQIESNADYLQAMSLILRRTALSAFGNQFDVGLKGNDWLAWLDNQCEDCKHQFSQGAGKALLIGPYQKNPEFDRTALHALAECWISKHRNQWQKAKNTKEANSHV